MPESFPAYCSLGLFSSNTLDGMDQINVFVAEGGDGLSCPVEGVTSIPDIYTLDASGILPPPVMI